MIVNADQLCEIFGFSAKTLYNYKNQGMPISGKDGKSVLYDTVKIHEWLESRTLSQAEGTDLTTERTRKTKIEADLAELEYKQRHGELVEMQEVKKEWEGLILSCRAKLMGLPSKLASVAMSLQSQDEIQQYITDEIYKSLEELSNSYV